MLKLKMKKTDNGYIPKVGDQVICIKVEGFNGEANVYTDEDNIMIGQIYTLDGVYPYEGEYNTSRYQYRFENKDYWHPSDSFKIWKKC